MSDVYFCRTRHTYESYADLWRLVELSGFPLIYVDEIAQYDAPDRVFIVTPQNGEWEHGVRAQGRVIHWNLEWSMYPPVPGVSEVWHMDAAFARQHGLKYVPVGGHAGLMDGERVGGVHYDVAFLAYMIPRRQRIHYQLQQLGVALSPTSAWGELRHSVLCNSTAYLHVHQLDDVQGVPALRMVVAAAYKLPVITEAVTDAGIFRGTVAEVDYDDLARIVPAWLFDRNLQLDYEYALKRNAERLHQLLCVEYTFRRVIEDAL